MKIAVMQPYFMPYLGYFKLWSSVDAFVVYDNIKYTKKGWINRNRILVNGEPEYITLPLKRDSDFKDVRDRHLSEGVLHELQSTLGKIKQAYSKAPYFSYVFPLIEKIFSYQENNLFAFIYNSLKETGLYLQIQTPLLISSQLDTPQGLKSEERVIAICKSQHASVYLNPPGGVGLYHPEHFKLHGIELQFMELLDFQYKQFDRPFVPFLSIIDVMMFNSKDEIIQQLRK